MSSAEGGAHNIGKAGFRYSFEQWAPFLTKRINWILVNATGYSDDYPYRISEAARKLIAGAESYGLSSLFDPSLEDKLNLAGMAVNFTFGPSDIELSNSSDATYYNDLLFRNRLEIGTKNVREKEIEERQSRWLAYEAELKVLFQLNSFDEFGDMDDGFRSIVDQLSGETIGQSSYMEASEARPKEYKNYGEYEIDYVEQPSISIPARCYDDPWKARRQMRGMVEAEVFSQHIMPWDKESVSISMLEKILANLETEKPSFWHGVVTLSLLLGMMKKTIEKIKILELDHDIFKETNGEISISKGIYLDPSKRLLWWFAARGVEHRKRYMPVDALVCIKLPSVIGRGLPIGKKSGERVFSKEAFRAASRYLKMLGADGTSSITLKRLRQTFQAFFIHGAGFPQLSADILSCQVSRHLISQHYYVTKSFHDIYVSWNQMTNAFIDGIQGRHDMKEILTAMNKSKLEAWDSREINTDPSKLNKSAFIGATSTPLRKNLQDHFNHLWGMFPHDREKLICASDDEWNAYMAYLYGAYAVTVGQRPLRDPTTKISLINLSSSHIFIDDKHNKSFRESRCVPVCRTLVDMLTGYFDIKPHWVRERIRAGYCSSCDFGQFLIADHEEKCLLRISPQQLDRVLSHKVEPEYFSDIKNGYRHYLLTTLHNAGIDQYAIDFLSGHRRVGSEPENQASPVSWPLLAKYLSDIIEDEVVKHLELKAPF